MNYTNHPAPVAAAPNAKIEEYLDRLCSAMERQAATLESIASRDVKDIPF